MFKGKLLIGLFATCLATESPNHAQALDEPSGSLEIEFSSHEIEVSEDADIRLLFTGPLTAKHTDDVVVVTTEGEHEQAYKSRFVDVYSLEGDAFHHVASTHVPARHMDIWTYQDGVALLSAHSEGIDRFDASTGMFVPWLIIAEGSAKQKPLEKYYLSNFSRDLNGDDLDDIVYVSGEELIIRTQLHDEELADPVVLSTSPRSEPRFSLEIDSPLTPREVLQLQHSEVGWQFSIYPTDYDGDGVIDLAIPYFEPDNEEGGGLWIHQGLREDGWKTGSTQVPIVAPTLDSRTSQHLFRIQDFNNDGIGDAAVFRLGEERLSHMDFYFGRHERGETVFPKSADTSISLNGWSVRLTEFSDLDGDGDIDFCAAPSRRGVGRVLGNLVRRSVSLILECYLMNDGAFSDVPSKVLKLHHPTDTPMPATLADVTGDGILDFVAPARKNRLKVYVGTGDANVFATHPIVVDIQLPKNGETILFRDLNRDSKSDMLVVPLDTGHPVWVALSQ